MKTWTKSFGNEMVKAVDWGCMTDELRNAITLSVMERWKKDRFKRTIKKLSQFDNKKHEKLELESDYFDVDNSYPTSPLIVDIDFVCKQLFDEHKACKFTSSLTQYQTERVIGLTSILYLSLQNCSTVTMVTTSIYDVKTKCAADMHTKFLLRYYL